MNASLVFLRAWYSGKVYINTSPRSLTNVSPVLNPQNWVVPLSQRLREIRKPQEKRTSPANRIEAPLAPLRVRRTFDCRDSLAPFFSPVPLAKDPWIQDESIPSPGAVTNRDDSLSEDLKRGAPECYPEVLPAPVSFPRHISG